MARERAHEAPRAKTTDEPAEAREERAPRSADERAKAAAQRPELRFESLRRELDESGGH